MGLADWTAEWSEVGPSYLAGGGWIIQEACVWGLEHRKRDVGFGFNKGFTVGL